MRLNSVLFICAALLFGNVSAAEQGSIAYLRQHNDNWQVWLYHPQSKEHQRLTDSAVDHTRVSWSKDRSQLLVNLNDGTLAWLNVATKELTPINLPIKGLLDAKLSYDDQSIAYSDIIYATKPNYNIWQVNLKNGKAEQLTNQSDLQNFPSWSADGSKIVYISGTSTSGHDVWQLDVASKSQTQLTSQNGYSFDPALNEKGDLLYSSNALGTYDVWLKPHNEETTQRLTKGSDYEGAPSWSPDGERIVYEVLRGSSRQLWIMNRDGSNAKPITPEDTSSRAPAWSK